MPGEAGVEAIILAAGKSSRMGENKLVADLGGRPMIAHVADAVAEAGLPPPVVVLGHEPEAVRKALRGKGARFVHAPDYARGLSASISAGIQAVAPAARAAIIFLGDMPFVPVSLIREMVGQTGPDAILVPRFHDRTGNPLLWGRRWFRQLAVFSGDIGARHLLEEHADRVRFIESPTDGIHIDVDTPSALEEASRRLASAD